MTPVLLATSKLSDDRMVELYRKGERIVAKCYQSGTKIGKCVLEGLDPHHQWTYESITPLALSKIRQLLEQVPSTWSKMVVVESEKLEQPCTMDPFHQDEELNESDGELKDLDTTLFVFKREMSIPAVKMTVPCKDKNVKGSTLIEIVHETFREKYEYAMDLVWEYEKDGRAAYPPQVKNGVLAIEGSRDWLLSVGGWKDMMPKEEVQWCLFAAERFSGVIIYNNGITFPIIENRIHLPENFFIGETNITNGFKRQHNKWSKTLKTDLSYPQILSAIDAIKKFGLDDSKIASIQLKALNRNTDLISNFDKCEGFGLIPDINRKQVVQFLDYLNSVMFGMETSGLNAALVTSLMTLDLIAERQLSYKLAFKANNDGGVYPYACFGDNSGTYSEREKILLHKKEYSDSLSMKKYRDNPSLSPVAIKEAALIKYWLSYNNVILGIDHAPQKVAIQHAVKDLMTYYFGPNVKYIRFLERFKKPSNT